MSKRCPRCGGGGRVPLSATEQGVVQRLSFEVPKGSDVFATQLGLSRQRIDGVLLALEYEGLARRLPRTAQGYEWLAALRSAAPVEPPDDTEKAALRTTILAAINNIAHGRTGAAQSGLRAARDHYGFDDWRAPK